MNYIKERFKALFQITSIEFRAAVLILISIAIVTSFKMALSKFNTTDIVPQIQPINTKVIKEFGAFTVKVKTGMLIKNLPVFDIKNSKFQIDAIVWFVFNPDEITLQTVQKFSFDKCDNLRVSPPDIRKIEDKLFVKYNVLFTVKSDLNYHKFPFEDHKIAIMMSNDFVAPNEMYFMADNTSFQAAPEIFPASWKLKDLNAEPGYMTLKFDKEDKTKTAQNPKVLFTINIEKTSIKKLLVLFIPLFVVAFFSLFAFLLSLGNTIGKFQLSITALTALLGYRFVIEQIIPQVGYFTTTDNIYLLLLIMAFVSFLFQILCGRQYEYFIRAHKDAPESTLLFWKRLNSFAFLGISLFFAISTVYIILN
ncbi:MAG: hypothetical protein ABH827_00790 [bacterium]